MRLIFIRHGDPDYERDSLTEKGWREAKLLAERVRKWDVKDFYCSPLGRAKDTASICLDKIKRNAVTCEWLKEFHIPIQDPSTGKKHVPWDFMPSFWTSEPMLYDKNNWYRAPVMLTGDIENSYKGVCEEMDHLLASYGYLRDGGFYRVKGYRDDTIVFFCHLGITIVILSHLLGISPVPLWQGFFLAPTSITILTSEERIEGEAFFRCQVMGDTTHLYEGGEPVSGAGYFTKPFQELEKG